MKNSDENKSKIDEKIPKKIALIKIIVQLIFVQMELEQSFFSTIGVK